MSGHGHYGGSGRDGRGGSGSYGGGYSDNRGGAHSGYDDRRDSHRDAGRHGYDSQSRDRDGRDDRGREERGQPPQGPPHSQASGSQGSSAEDPVFAQFCDEKDTCVCIFSAIGLAWLKGNPKAAKIIEEAIGGTLPERVPDGCKGSLKGGKAGLLAHAKAKKGGAQVRGKGDSSDSEDEDQAMLQKGHELFHAYLDRRISPRAQLAQAKRMMQGQHKEHSAQKQKLHETHHQRERQLVQHHEQEKQQERKEHQEAVEAERCKLESSMQALEDEFGKGFYDNAKQARKLEQVEAEKRLIQMELVITRRGLAEQEKQRKTELAAKLVEMQETNREVEQEREVQIKASSKWRVDELVAKLERKEEECTKLIDNNEDLEDLSMTTVRQNDILQSKLDAFFLVSVCVTEFASDAKLAKVGRDTIWKLRTARGETENAIKLMREAVRAFLEDPEVKIAHLKYIAASLTLDGRGLAENPLAYIELIMRQKFDASSLQTFSD